MDTIQAVKDFVLTCTISDIPQQLDYVTWTPSAEEEGYTSGIEEYDSVAKTQVTTLTISLSKLIQLYYNGNNASQSSEDEDEHEFICEATIYHKNAMNETTKMGQVNEDTDYKIMYPSKCN